MAHGFNPEGVWAPGERVFSQGVVQGPGEVVHVTGQVAWDEHSNVIGAGDAEAQLEKALENVAAILGEVGGRLSDVVSLTIYYLDRADLPAIQRVRARHFAPATAPVSILIQVAGLVLPEFLVEVVPIAVVPPDRYRPPRT
jgi:enamine deaminase RidA (YjgF/YER057c/UK114 family)